MMVWDIYVDGTEHLSKPSIMLVSLDPMRAMSQTGETSLDLKMGLFLKTMEYSWMSIVLLLNIPAIMKDIRLVAI
jgi:hypothetical protein